ncbi:YbgA family protein [Pseudomonas sp. NY15181]|uniref:YbgA family protein n=1 Tax=Pseudomonas sp. NY15181 TaxID=3400349 RepID=UPI003A8B3619
MPNTTPRPQLGISACLLGEPVRYNGGHKASRLCLDVLSRHFDFVPVCPEVAIGLGVPRPTLRLVGDHDSPRAVIQREGDRDVSEALRDFGREQAGRLEDICGYIFMQQSPSCGLQRVKLYRSDGHACPPGVRGLYAEAFCAARPELPVEEEGRLNDPVIRENFLTRVFAYAAWQKLCTQGLTRHALIGFHSRYKYQLMAHNPRQYSVLGQRLAMIGNQPLDDFAPAYFRDFMRALGTCATRGTHSNVLQHLAGYLKHDLPPAEKAEMQRLIGQYRDGVIPLVVPLTLLKHHFRRHPHPYIDAQAYLQPHPEDLSLRNAI